MCALSRGSPRLGRHEIEHDVGGACPWRTPICGGDNSSLVSPIARRRSRCDAHMLDQAQGRHQRRHSIARLAMRSNVVRRAICHEVDSSRPRTLRQRWVSSYNASSCDRVTLFRVECAAHCAQPDEAGHLRTALHVEFCARRRDRERLRCRARAMSSSCRYDSRKV